MNAVLAPALEFAPMVAADVAAIMETENRIYPFPWSEGNFRDSLVSGYSAWVCREAGAMVGYGVMMLALDEAHLLNISVVLERQRGGLGSRLLEFLFAEAKARGAARMFLEVRPSNTSGLGLYRRFGFEEIGRRRGYYPAHEGREDAIVMARDLR